MTRKGPAITAEPFSMRVVIRAVQATKRRQGPV